MLPSLILSVSQALACEPSSMYATKSYSICKPGSRLVNLAQCMLPSLILSVSQALAFEPSSMYATKSYSIYKPGSSY